MKNTKKLLGKLYEKNKIKNMNMGWQFNTLNNREDCDFLEKKITTLFNNVVVKTASATHAYNKENNCYTHDIESYCLGKSVVWNGLPQYTESFVEKNFYSGDYEVGDLIFPSNSNEIFVYIGGCKYLNDEKQQTQTVFLLEVKVIPLESGAKIAIFDNFIEKGKLF